MIRLRRDEEFEPGSTRHYTSHRQPTEIDPRDVALFRSALEDPDEETGTPEDKDPSKFKSASEMLEFQKDGGKLTEEDLLDFQKSGGKLSAEDIRKFQKQGGKVSAEFLLEFQANGGKLTDSDLHKLQKNGMELTCDDLLKFQENGIKLTGGDIRKFQENGMKLTSEDLHKLQEAGTELTVSDLRAFRDAGMELNHDDILRFQKNGVAMTGSDILGFQKGGIEFTEMDLMALSLNGVKFTGGNLITFSDQGGKLTQVGVILLETTGVEISDAERDKLVEKGVLPYVSKIPPEATYEEVMGMIDSGVDLDIKDITAHFDAHPEMWMRAQGDMAMAGLNCRDKGDTICYLAQMGVKMDSKDVVELQEKYHCFTGDDIPWLAEEGLVSFTADDLVKIANAGCELSASQFKRIGLEVTPEQYTEIVA